MTQNRQTKQRPWRKWIFVALGLLIAIVGVPIGINECYKTNTGYITVWNGADVLGYYGTVMASIIGIIGVYLTVYISNKNYREDARNRILPYIAINVINIRQPDPFFKGFEAEDYSMMKNDPIIENSLSEQERNHLFYIIDGKSKIRATEFLFDDDAKKMKESEVLWRRAAKDGKMYLRESEYVSIPFTLENIGVGVAKNLHMSFSCIDQKPFFKTEIIMKPNERFYIHIFSEQKFEVIKGVYTFAVYYEDIAGNQYSQQFPLEIVEENGNKYKRIDTNGKQILLGRKNNA